MMARARKEDGLAMMSVLLVIFVLVVLSALVLYLSGKEIGLSAVRLLGAQSLNIAEGGAFSGRAGLMALMSADPTGFVLVDQSVGPRLNGWYARGNPANQNAFGILDYLTLDGQRFSLNAPANTEWAVFYVNWGLAPRRKLQLVQIGQNPPPANPLGLGAPPVNTLGTGNYSAAVVLRRRQAISSTDPACGAPPGCYIHGPGLDEYEYFYTYEIVSDGRAGPRARRRVTLQQDFSVVVRRENFARYALFTHEHLTPDGQPIWFTSRTSFDGPVHTNGEFRFAFFPKFGAPDSLTPCDPNRARSTTLTSVSVWTWFNNLGSRVRLQANENVVNGVRRDAPVLPDCTADVADDRDNLPAAFTRGFDADLTTPPHDPVVVPANSFSQKGIAIGRDPTNTSPVTNLQIRQAVPELADNGTAVPTGIYVPVSDVDADSRSDPGEPLAGGIFVQGDLNSLTLSLGGASNNLAVYTLVQGGQTVTITVDRVGQTTTVTNTAWASPQTRTFAGVPKGWQGGGSIANATVIFVEGNVLSLSGTLEEHEQITIATSGRIDITNHLRYEDPPDVADPNDNPLNVLGLFSHARDIRIALSAPSDLVIHGVLMAGTPGPNDPDPAYNSSVHAVNYNSRPVQGQVHLIGGIIEEYYGAFGTFDPATGNPLTGYGRDFQYDRRMSRGFSPPYFPTTTLFTILEGSSRLTNVRPVWREASP